MKTARSEEEDIALRRTVNKFIDASNEKQAETAVALLESLWERYFSGGRVYVGDGDILEAVLNAGAWCCPELLKYKFYAAHVGIKGEPVLYKTRESRLNEASRFLLGFRDNKTSQDGEDGIIQKIFEIIGARSKWCVEFGAYDGLENCNTHTLVTEEDWTGVFIEGDSGRYVALEKTYAQAGKAHTVKAFVGHGRGLTPLETILSDLDAPEELDLLSIDVDGNDWHIWSELKGYRARVVIVEFNPTIANDIVFIQQNEHDVMQGNSLRAFIMLGKEKGYELVCVTLFNAIFVVKEEYDKFGIPDNSIDAMYEPFMDGRIFNCYDASIMNVGMPQLLWAKEGQETDTAMIGYDEIGLVRKKVEESETAPSDAPVNDAS